MEVGARINLTLFLHQINLVFEVDEAFIVL